MELKQFLEQKHPHYLRMMQKPHWPTMRAVFGGLVDDAVKKDFLVTGTIEKPTHFEIRRKLTQPLGAASGICNRILGRIFQDRPVVTYETEGDSITTIDGYLSSWADDVDGQGTSLEELIEKNAREPLQVGILGYHIDRPMVEGEFNNLGQQAEAGALDLRVNVYKAEEIVDWDTDRDGLNWVKLQHVVHEMDMDADGLGERKTFMEWVLIDREKFRIWRCDITGDETSLMISKSATLNDGEEYAHQIGSFEIGEKAINEVTPPNNLHMCGMVPFAVHYGDEVGPLMSNPPLEGAARADLAAINADSIATWQEWLHGNQLLVLETDRDVKKVFLDGNSIMKLSPGAQEKASYITNDADAFEHGRKVVEKRILESHRQAGADPVGMFEGALNAESGVAKDKRHASTTELSLIQAAASAQDVHWSILEIAKRLMMPGAPAIGESQFKGAVQYPSKFDLADPDTLSSLYLELKPHMPSSTWNETMLKRIAELSVGEVAKDTRDMISDEITQFQKNQNSLSNPPTQDDISNE